MGTSMAQPKSSLASTLERLLLFCGGIFIVVAALFNPRSMSLLPRAITILGGALAISLASMPYWPVYRKWREELDREIDDQERELNEAGNNSK
jgi:hypothetical protein